MPTRDLGSRVGLLDARPAPVVLIASTEEATVADTARRLFLSEGTIRDHLSAAIQTLGAHNRAEAVRIAQAKGWLEPGL